VVIPTYNGATFLADALNGIAHENVDDIEIIAVDDGSTDETTDILRSYQTAIPLDIVEQGRVGNWVTGTNQGLRRASGRYSTILHQDDLWLPGRLDVARRWLTTRSANVFLVHPVFFVDAEGRTVGKWRCPLPSGHRIDPNSVLERLLIQDFISIPAATFPRELALEVGGLDEELWYTADWDFWLKLAASTSTVHVPRTLAAVRLHHQSITSRWTAELGEFRQQHEAVLHRHLDRWAVEPERKQSVRVAAEFSIEMNTWLAGIAHGQRPSSKRVLERLINLGPRGLSRYIKASRILERGAARLRAGIGLPWEFRRS
jgi:glycosyltransferase involved in cell wall biosynthesis